MEEKSSSRSAQPRRAWPPASRSSDDFSTRAFPALSRWWVRHRWASSRQPRKRLFPAASRCPTRPERHVHSPLRSLNWSAARLTPARCPRSRLPRRGQPGTTAKETSGRRWRISTLISTLSAALRGSAGSVIGHGDWYALNLRWSGNRLRVAHDWDSLIADSEPVIAGLAAAVFPITQIGTSATVDETREFLREYAAARGRQFTSDQLEECWAAGVWVRSYEVKRELATTGTIRSMARVEAEERLRPAGH